MESTPRITYTASNRAHHYPYAEALSRAGALQAFISGFSRFSPRSPLPELGQRLKRKDFFQNIYMASLRFKLGQPFTHSLNKLATYSLDMASYSEASQSEIFMYYRTQGFHTMRKLRRKKFQTLCITEEVNSHVDHCYSLMNEEYRKSHPGKEEEKYPDHDLRIRTYEEADYILCPSEFVRHSFIDKGFPAEQILKMNYGIAKSKPAMNREKAIQADSFTILYVGQLHYRKGLRYLVKAFSQLKHPDKRLIIVGPNTESTGLEGISIPKEAIFTGALKGEELERAYLSADVFVLPSIEDGFGLVVPEAMSYGIPVITTYNTGASEIIKEGKDGYIVPPANAVQIGERLQQLCDDRWLLREMAASAQRTFQDLPDWDETVKNFLATASKLVRKKNSA